MPKYGAMLPFMGALDEFMNIDDERERARILADQQAFENTMKTSELDLRGATLNLSRQIAEQATIPQAEASVEATKLGTSITRGGEERARAIDQILVDETGRTLEQLKALAGAGAEGETLTRLGERKEGEAVVKEVGAAAAGTELSRVTSEEQTKVAPGLIKSEADIVESESVIKKFEANQAEALNKEKYMETYAEVMVQLLELEPKTAQARIDLMKAQKAGELATEDQLRAYAEEKGLDWDKHLLQAHMGKIAVPYIVNIRLATSHLSNIEASKAGALEAMMSMYPSMQGIPLDEEGKKRAVEYLKAFIKTQKEALKNDTMGMIDYDKLLADYDERTKAPVPEFYDPGGLDVNDLLPKIDAILKKGKK